MSRSSKSSPLKFSALSENPTCPASSPPQMVTSASVARSTVAGGVAEP